MITQIRILCLNLSFQWNLRDTRCQQSFIGLKYLGCKNIITQDNVIERKTVVYFQ